jgi:hypothetical protein
MQSTFLHRFHRTRLSEPELIDPKGLACGSEDDSDYNDLSYEDAIFDLELRTFFRTEYGTSEPSPEVANQLFDAIEKHVEPVTRSHQHIIVSPLRQLSAFLQGAFAGPTLPRIVSSAIAILIGFSSFGPTFVQLLNNSTAYQYQIPLSKVPTIAIHLPSSVSDPNSVSPAGKPSADIQPILYDPNYDNPATWTSKDTIGVGVSQWKFNTKDFGQDDVPPRIDTRRLEKGPQ